MIRTATIDGGQANRRHLTLANGTGYWRSDLLISAETDSPAPQAFLIQQDPATVIRSHFHSENQFQVVAEGGGTIGRHRLAPLSVHYASRYTGYGPIVSGSEGLSYFTFRAVMTPYAHFLPESRDRMADVPRRNLMGHTVALSDANTLRGRSEPEADMALETQPDGVMAQLLRLPPRVAHRVPAQGADRFYLVTGGAMLARGQRLPRFATAFATADEPDFDLATDDEGLEVLILQFPVTGPR